MISLARGRFIINDIIAEMDKTSISVPENFSMESITKYTEVMDCIRDLLEVISNTVNNNITEKEYHDVFTIEVGITEEELLEIKEAGAFVEPKYKSEEV